MNKKSYKPAKPFIEKLLKDKDIKIIYEEERAKTLIAEAVRTARIQAGLTQTELANIAHTTQSVVSRIESGVDTRTPSLSLLAKIGAACNAKLTFGFTFN